MVGEHRRQRRQFGGNLHAALAGLGLDEAEAVVDDLGERTRGTLRFALPDEVVHTADDAAGALGLDAKFLERLADLLRVESAGRQEVQATRVVAGDRRQRLVQFVRQRRRHFAHGYQARGELQLFLLLARQFLLSLIHI